MCVLTYFMHIYFIYFILSYFIYFILVYFIFFTLIQLFFHLFIFIHLLDNFLKIKYVLQKLLIRPFKTPEYHSQHYQALVSTSQLQLAQASTGYHHCLGPQQTLFWQQWLCWWQVWLTWWWQGDEGQVLYGVSYGELQIEQVPVLPGSEYQYFEQGMQRIDQAEQI